MTEEEKKRNIEKFHKYVEEENNKEGDILESYLDSEVEKINYNKTHIKWSTFIKYTDLFIAHPKERFLDRDFKIYLENLKHQWGQLVDNTKRVNVVDDNDINNILVTIPKEYNKIIIDLNDSSKSANAISSALFSTDIPTNKAGCEALSKLIFTINSDIIAHADTIKYNNLMESVDSLRKLNPNNILVQTVDNTLADKNKPDDKDKDKDKDTDVELVFEDD